MKPLSYFLLSLTLLLCACHHNQPPTTVTLPISETYVPATIDIDASTISDEFKHQLFQLVNNKHVVNSLEEIPADPFGSTESFARINFKENTLLIMYLLHDYTIDTYRNTYYLQYQENVYNWSVNIGTATDFDNFDVDKLQFTRFAIVVNKLPADAQVKTWHSLTALGWYPGN